MRQVFFYGTLSLNSQGYAKDVAGFVSSNVTTFTGAVTGLRLAEAGPGSVHVVALLYPMFLRETTLWN
jgi:hypothetical protein